MLLVSTAAGMPITMGILTAEMLIEGQKGGRLTWPYGDLVGVFAKVTRLPYCYGSSCDWRKA